MARDPAFLFYTGDFTTGTQFLSDEQVGKYVRLLMAQHQLGHLSEKHMLQICKTHDKDVFSKFIQDSDGLYFNQRLDNEINKRKKYSESRSENRRSKSNISFTYDKHMENNNNNKDILSSLGDLPTMTKGDFLEFHKKLLRDDIFTNPLMMGRGIKNKEELENWIIRYDTHISGEGKINKDYSEYRKHFKNWIFKQDTFNTTASKPEKKMVL